MLPSRLPLLHTSPLARVPSPLPRRNDRVRISLTCPITAAFLVIMASRLPHRYFRGLHGVHSRYRPRAALPPLQRGSLEVLQAIRRLLARSKCFRPEREWPGGYLTHRTRVPSTRHTQQRHRKPDPSVCSGTAHLALLSQSLRRPRQRQSLLPGIDRSRLRHRAPHVLELHLRAAARRRHRRGARSPAALERPRYPAGSSTHRLTRASSQP